MSGPPADGRPFGARARVAGGLLLLTVASALALIDTMSTEYAVDSVPFGLLLGTALALLAVEGGRALLDRAP